MVMDGQLQLLHLTMVILFDEHYDTLIKMIKINNGEPPGKTVQPQGLYDSGLC